LAFFQVVAVDFDGTLTSGELVCPEAVDAIEQVRRNGLVVVLVSGRIGVELHAKFPEIAGHFDALVLENGAVAVIDGTTRALSAPVDAALDDALADRGVPYRRGEVLVAVDGEHAATVVEVIGELGLDCQIVRNRAALMVLPAGVTKASGLAAVLAVRHRLTAADTQKLGSVALRVALQHAHRTVEPVQRAQHAYV